MAALAKVGAELVAELSQSWHWPGIAPATELTRPLASNVPDAKVDTLFVLHLLPVLYFGCRNGTATALSVL